jgi:hypothetical protein
VRWLAILLLFCSGEAAARRIVISDPPIVMACREGKSWAIVEACLARQGKLTAERTLPAAKLVRIVQNNEGTPLDLGVYLYIRRADGSWKIGGMFEGTAYVVVDLVPLTLQGHAGYRLDIGQIMRSSVSLDGETSVPSILATRRVLFCAGDSYGCPDATTQCDVLIHGKTLWTFRGKLVFEPEKVKVVGDRSRGGQMCVPSEDVYLGWPTKP